MYLCVPCVCLGPAKPEKNFRYPEIGVTDCELPCECWGSKLGPPQEQSVLLTRKSSFQPHGNPSVLMQKQCKEQRHKLGSGHLTSCLATLAHTFTTKVYFLSILHADHRMNEHNTKFQTLRPLHKRTCWRVFILQIPLIQMTEHKPTGCKELERSL